MLIETKNLEDISNIDIQSLKRTTNILLRKQVVEENNTLTEEEKEVIINYPNQKELWALYKLSQNQYASFKDMIMGVSF